MLSLRLLLISTLVLSCLSTSIFRHQEGALAQQYIQTVKHRNLVIDLGKGLKTNAQLTFPAIGKGPFPAVLLISGSGAEEMNSSAIFIRIDNKTGSKIYPPVPLFQIAKYLSERGITVLRYDKRGIGENHTILDSNVWGNMTINDLVQDANKALSVLMKQPEVDRNRITVLGHSEGTVITPLLAIENPDKVKNIVLMGAAAQNFSDIIEYQLVGLPLIYAKQVLDKNNNGLISVQNASRDSTFQSLINGNLSYILMKLENGTLSPKPERNHNNDTYINIDTQLKPVLIKLLKLFPSPPPSPFSSALESSPKCMNLEGCRMWLNSFIALEPNLNTIAKTPVNTSILILNGENDTQTPVEQAMLLQQKLTEIKHPDHVLITYPNLGHEFYPSSEWQSQHGPIKEYVLGDLYSWLEYHSGLSNSSFTASTASTIGANTSSSINH
jgi:pimeloyl-ACP methyl ester carboxylesterase